MKIQVTGFILTCISFIACRSEDHRRLVLLDEIVEGNIDKQGIYNGLIKTYEKGTNRLTSTAYYDNDTMNGARTEYYPSGKVRMTSNYERGKIHGLITVYDSNGRLDQSQYRYYDLRVGPSIDYEEGGVADYYFYSFDNQELMHIDYDSLQFKSVGATNNSRYFFWHVVGFDYGTTPDSMQEELFLYLPNPAKLNFKYSLCIVDEELKIASMVQEWESNDHWATIELNRKILKPGQSFALRLKARNELRAEGEATMLKRL